MALSAAAARRRGALAHPIDRQLGEFIGNLRDVNVFFPVPTRSCVAHAQDRERRQTRTQISTEFTLRNALPDDALEDAFKPARHAANAPAALARQVLTLIEEYFDEVGSVDKG